MFDFIFQWIDQHGYVVLFFVPMLELLFLPVSAEIVMEYAGVLVFQGKLNWLMSILFAGTGSAVGMSLSYWIGFKLGTPFFEKYGSRIHMGPERLNKTSLWFQRFGNKIIIIAYFIMGVRHVTGYFSGITRIPFRIYSLYAYSGAFLWAIVFISLGKLLGPQWEQYHTSINRYLLIISIIIAIMFILFYLYNKYKFNIVKFSMKILKKGQETLHSLRRVTFMIVISFLVCLTFVALMIGLVEDLFANEFAQFDMVTSFLIHAMFDESWSSLMNGFAFLASFKVLLPVVLLTFWWMIIKGTMIEAFFLFITVIGGEMWDEGLRFLFHREGPLPSIKNPYTFPSEQTFITVVVLGFAAFLLVRHLRSIWIRYFVPLIVVVISLLVGLSCIYFEVQYPSDVTAGYVFGGIWLSLNIVLLEIFRMLRKDKRNFST